MSMMLNSNFFATTAISETFLEDAIIYTEAAKYKDIDAAKKAVKKM